MITYFIIYYYTFICIAQSVLDAMPSE